MKSLGKKPIDAFSTHREVLIQFLEKVNPKRVLEFGVGNFSTPLLHHYSKQGNIVLSMDNNPEWLNKFRGYEHGNHRLLLFNNDDLLLQKYSFFEDNWSMIFVDAAPAWIRSPFIRLIKSKADYIIVHDTEAGVYNYDFSGFPHVWNYTKLTPWTTILSNLENPYDFNKLIS